MNGWVDETPKKLYLTFHCLGPHLTEHAHCLIKELYIVSIPQFKRDGSLHPVLLVAMYSMEIYHCSVGTHLGLKNYVYTKLCKCAKKSEIKDFNSPRNDPLIILDYWSKNIEEYFHLRNHTKINLSGKYTTQDMTNVMNSMVNHVNSTEQGMIVTQEKLIESYNERLKKSICIDQLIREIISTQKSLHH